MATPSSTVSNSSGTASSLIPPPTSSLSSNKNHQNTIQTTTSSDSFFTDQPTDNQPSSSLPSSSWCSQTTIHQNFPSTLPTLFSSLKLFSDKNSLLNTFTLLKSNQHLFHSQWFSLFERFPNLFEISFELLQKFEINGLQLHGLGCWFFHQILTTSSSFSTSSSPSFASSSSPSLSSSPLPIISIHNSQKYSPEVIIELLLRILLEHPVSNICISIFSEILKYKSDAVMLICQIGQSSPPPLLPHLRSHSLTFLSP